MQVLDTFERAAVSAGQAIMEVFEAGATVRLKDDASPVTEADERAERIILSILATALPDTPVVAEESAAAGKVPEVAGRPFILVDPLDGTKEFVNRREDFTVNIALVVDGAPVAGVVYAPARGVAYCGSSAGAEKLLIAPDFTISARKAIHARPVAEEMVAVASRSHSTPETEMFLDRQRVSSRTSVGSSLKFCLLAEGVADVYPRFGRTMEWDTAAGDAVLRAAGGMTLDLDGLPLRYGKVGQATDSDFANPSFIAWGRRQPV